MKSLAEVRIIANTWKGPKSFCICGHTGDGNPSQHYTSHGHGPCKVEGCTGCQRFTWEHWTPEFEAATK